MDPWEEEWLYSAGEETGSVPVSQCTIYVYKDFAARLMPHAALQIIYILF